jgi:pantoate kinase
LESEAASFSPAHITGFFQILDRPRNPLFKGSRGAGVSLTKGVKTTVHINKSPKKNIEIKINGRLTEAAQVSNSVANAFLSIAGANCKLLIEHDVDVPIGCGLGSSGAGALGLAFALNEALGLGLTKIEVAQAAHVAEVKCKTGLGTVIAELSGGLEIRTKPGAPGIGEVKPIRVDGDYVVICLPFGPMSTKKALTDPKLRRLINKHGGKLVEELVAQPSVGRFLELSRSFAEKTMLISERVRKVLTDVDNHGFASSMAIFGETVFSVVKQNESEELTRIFRKHAQGKYNIINAEIDFAGARILQ